MRPWYRIHWPTLFVLAIVLAWLVFINIPGDPINALWSNRFYHGWPYHYYVRGGEDHSYWSFTQPTPWFGKPPQFDVQALLLNVLIAICIVALAACPCELWIRHNGRLFRFGTRSILVLTTVVAVIMGLAAREVRRCYRQQQAIRELEQIGAVTMNRSRQKYDWFRSFVGAELHGVVTGVDLVATVPVERLPDLRQLESIRSIGMELVNPPENIGQLAELPKLKYVSVKLTSLAGAEPERLTELTEHPQLWRLHLVGDEFNDAVISHISRDARIEQLSIQSTKITEAALVQISEMDSLTVLHLDECVLKNLDYSVLDRLTNLNWLTFIGKNLTAQDTIKLRSQSLWPNATYDSGTTQDTWEPYISIRKQ
jgi:hypothetical protein